MELKLKALDLHVEKPTLFLEYNRLNPYYNATKHRNPNNETLLKEIYGPFGKEITIKYYESVRLILRWFYIKYFIHICI
jgi:hypothetical protein